MNRPLIPFFGIDRQYRLIQKELSLVTNHILSSGRVMDGPHTQELEHNIAQYENMPHGIIGVAVHSGTNALEMAAQAVAQRFFENYDHGKEFYVFVPALTFVATANAMVRGGLTPVFVDVDRYGMIDVNKIDLDLLAGYPCALAYVGLYGQCYNNNVIDFVKHHQLMVIEDAAQHFGSNKPGFPTGTLGDYTCLSFDPTKHLAAHGNGGMIMTRDGIAANSFRSLRAHDNALQNGRPGTNSRISEVDAATLNIKFRHFPDWQKRRVEIAKHYTEKIHGHGSARVVCHDLDFPAKHSWQKFVIEVDRRDELRAHLRDRNIETRIHYEQPVHELNYFQQFKNPGLLSVASSLSRRVLSLPIYPELTDGEVEFVAETVRKWLTKP